MSWPKQVPVLKPEDFVVGPMCEGDRYCLLGWRRRIFDNLSDVEGTKIGSMESDAAQEAGDRNIFYMGNPDTVANRKIAARAWAILLRKLGYTEDGPTVEM